jgi:hypothetical protein
VALAFDAERRQPAELHGLDALLDVEQARLEIVAALDLVALGRHAGADVLDPPRIVHTVVEEGHVALVEDAREAADAQPVVEQTTAATRHGPLRFARRVAVRGTDCAVPTLADALLGHAAVVVFAQ